MKTLVTKARALLHRIFFWLPSAHPSEERTSESEHHHALVLSVNETRNIPSLRQFRYLSRVLSLGERRFLLLALAIFLASTGTALGVFVHGRTVSVPTVGGTMVEALIGEPKFVNPIDASANDVDADISALIYSGLFRMGDMDVKLDLAEKYNWSADGKTLTVTLRQDARFHNGSQVTADDVQFTIESIQDPQRDSPLAPLFHGVTVTTVDDKTVQFTLDRTDSRLLTALTVGILPADLWQGIPAQNARLADLNTKPVGSGPYRFKGFTRDNKGALRSFTLERDENYYGLKPNIKTLVFQFFPDRTQAEDALKGNVVDSLAFPDLSTWSKESSRWQTVRLELPQETVAFFNIKDNLLADEHLRKILIGVIDRQEIVDAWHSFASPVAGPFPFGDATATVVTLDQARTELDSLGWTLPAGVDTRVLMPKTKSGTTATSTASSKTLELTITTTHLPELEATAEVLKRRWSLLGVRVKVETLELNDLLKRTTRDRTAQVVMINVLLGQEQDLLSFWWSGQTGDRGLNMSNLSDREVDGALQDVHSATTTEALQRARTRLGGLINSNGAAAFLVRPTALYAIDKSIHGTPDHEVISRPADRFQDIANWYIKTGWRWK